jgi:hypothetical protein
VHVGGGTGVEAGQVWDADVHGILSLTIDDEAADVAHAGKAGARSVLHPSSL